MPQDATPSRAETIDRLSDAVLVAVVRESSEARARAVAEAGDRGRDPRARDHRDDARRIQRDRGAEKGQHR